MVQRLFRGVESRDWRGFGAGLYRPLLRLSPALYSVFFFFLVEFVLERAEVKGGNTRSAPNCAVTSRYLCEAGLDPLVSSSMSVLHYCCLGCASFNGMS